VIRKREEVIVDRQDIHGTDSELINSIGDLLQLCKNGDNSRKLNVLLYMVLRYFSVTWRDADSFLTMIGGMRWISTHKWVEVFLTGDYQTFASDYRGGNQKDAFFDVYPKIEMAAKVFVAEACSRKSADFTAGDVATFIDSYYYASTNSTKADDELIRSERMGL
jgi:hypothetical protein